MSDAKVLQTKIEELHNWACSEGKDFYLDPDSGYLTMTKLFHLRRGSCCGSKCRHCPYGVSPGAEDDSKLEI